MQFLHPNLFGLVFNYIGETVSFTIPPAEVTMTEDGQMYKIQVGDLVQFVSSMHLVDEHIKYLEGKYRKRYSTEQQPYIE